MTIKNKTGRYFHVTPIGNLESILANGLVPQIGKRSKEIGEVQARIYLFSKFEEMENALMNWLGEAFEESEELGILQIDLPNDFPIKTEVDSNGDEFYESYAYDVIPPNFIVGVYNELYEFLKIGEENIYGIGNKG